MTTTDLLVLGLLVLVANLTLSALFIPPKTSPSPAEPLVRLWKLLALAFAQIAAWAVVLDQGGAAGSLSDAILRAAGCFALVSGVQGAPVFPEPWNHFAGLIALNGLLFVPVTLLPALFPTAAPSATPAAEPASSAAAASVGSPSAPEAHGVPAPVPAPVPAAVIPAPVSAQGTSPAPAAAPAPTPSPAPVPPPVSLSAAASPLVAEPARHPERQVAAAAPKRPSEPVDPEAEYAALMRPLGPTPPPIRFGNRP
jgi:hypothetical protein